MPQLDSACFHRHVVEGLGLFPSACIVVGVSGGVDSVVLLRLFHEAGFAVTACHVNYGLRGAESDGDEAFVRALAEELGLPVRVRRVELPEEGNRQEAARDERYAFFRETAEAEGAETVAVAHHQNDQAETVLLNLFRGTGPHGLAGMPASRPLAQDSPIQLIRPLLGWPRADIEALARERGWAWREDASNASDTYRRNWLRNQVLPLIEKEFGEGVSRRIADVAERIRAVVGLVDGGASSRLPINELRALPRAQRHSLYLSALRQFAPAAPRRAEAVAELEVARRRLKEPIGRVVIGQHDVIEGLLVSLLAGGHCLLVGVPGLAKTLLIRTLAQALDLSFGRIQFTPDLMPSDITGTDVLEEDHETGRKVFRFVHGPVFHNIILADEINRTPPKTQAALLEAMQEHSVTAGGNTMPLPEPFFVLATQNPIEQEGTYPLPEAQLDRFLFELRIDYPDAAQEAEIVRTTTSADPVRVTPVLTGEQIVAFQRLVRRVPVADHLVNYAVRLVRSTRPADTDAPDYVKELISWGAGPRASQFLVLAGKARAVLYGRHSVSMEDIRAVALPVLRHRIIVNFHAEAQAVNGEDLARRLLDSVQPDGSAA